MSEIMDDQRADAEPWRAVFARVDAIGERREEAMRLVERCDVALYAAWCMGSCHGDDDPGCAEMAERVMTDDETFNFYREHIDEQCLSLKPRLPYLEDVVGSDADLDCLGG